ncbi:MAG: hypothetical protein JWO36_6405 [Myxococcales bacterium]|nr:hypothetical protein [Myxococcales bacterium]
MTPARKPPNTLRPSKFKLVAGIALSACGALVGAAFGAIFTSFVF